MCATFQPRRTHNVVEYNVEHFYALLQMLNNTELFHKEQSSKQLVVMYDVVVHVWLLLWLLAVNSILLFSPPPCCSLYYFT